MWQIVIRLALVLLLVGCATMPPARLKNKLDPLQVATHLTMAVHYHMDHGRVPAETWDIGEALQRGIGLCSQQSIALHGLFKMFGMQSRVYGLDGHVVCLALIDDKWIVCDPDYGVVVPIDISDLEAEPMLATPYYGRELPCFDKEGNHGY